jgi:hypothetical protein
MIRGTMTGSLGTSRAWKSVSWSYNSERFVFHGCIHWMISYRRQFLQRSIAEYRCKKRIHAVRLSGATIKATERKASCTFLVNMRKDRR